MAPGYNHAHGRDSVPHAETIVGDPGYSVDISTAAPPLATADTGGDPLTSDSALGPSTTTMGWPSHSFDLAFSSGEALLPSDFVFDQASDVLQAEQRLGMSAQPDFFQHADFDQNSTTGGINNDEMPSFPLSWEAFGSGGIELPPHLPVEDSAKPPAKIGNRFSREAVQRLRAWMTTHERSPYLNDRDKAILQAQTGLTELQVTNWIANARRRRNKARGSSSSTPIPASTSSPLSIPGRPGTPMVGNSPHADPIRRWFDSPPEDEPAAASAIARAMAAESRLRDEADAASRGLSRTPYGSSSASSVASSHSDSSSAMSASSAVSWNSSSGIKKYPRPRPHRKRRARHPKQAMKPLKAPFRPYQCTFCTDTFGTKHDWQRHEKSLHLSVDRWRCAPGESRVVRGQDGIPLCIFCGQARPDAMHMESHNPHVCQQRIFSRKDHLKQHLRLVHGAKLVEAFAEQWKTPSPPVISRCGFCDLTLDSWSFRVDHLADHFKSGQTIADWKGDWGFEQSVLDMVENAIPPYLISTERSTPFPFAASAPAVESPRCAYEMIKLELLWYIQGHNDETGETPNSDALQLEACRVILASESRTPEDALAEPGAASWLRDLVTSRDDIIQQAKFAPIRSEAENVSATTMVMSKSLFMGCPLEAQLQDFAIRMWASGKAALEEEELQTEACRIIMRIDKEFAMPEYDFMEKWLVGLATNSKSWLQEFRQRASSLLKSHEQLMANTNAGLEEAPSLKGTTNFDHPFSVMDEENGPGQSSLSYTDNPANQPSATMSFPDPTFPAITAEPFDPWPSASTVDQRPTWVKTNFYVLNNSKFHHYVTRELKRWAKATMSPSNPNCHIPSDEELRHQARFIMYDEYVTGSTYPTTFDPLTPSNSDDIWNTTPADNCEWLRRFKSEAGIDGAVASIGSRVEDVINVNP